MLFDLSMAFESEFTLCLSNKIPVFLWMIVSAAPEFLYEMTGQPKYCASRLV